MIAPRREKAEAAKTCFQFFINRAATLQERIIGGFCPVTQRRVDYAIPFQSDHVSENKNLGFVTPILDVNTDIGILND
jgi:hypothetical protein